MNISSSASMTRTTDGSISVNRLFILRISLVAALGGLLFGFDTAVISGTIPYITRYFQLDAGMLGWAVGCILIGCAIGAMLAGAVADRWGRRTVLVCWALLFALSGLGAGLCHQLTSFVLFRIVGGLGVGAAAMVSPMYISETAPADQRGKLVSLYQLAIVMGILLAYFSNYLFDGMGENSWRLMFASQAAPAVIFLLLLAIVPESPRWLVLRGRVAAASVVLVKIFGEGAQRELEQIAGDARKDGASSLGLLFSRSYRGVLVVGVLVAVFQQVTGINAILYYAPVIFKETGLDSSGALLQTIGIGVVNVLSTFIAIGFVDKVGRKKFLVAGSVVMGLSLAAVGVCFSTHYFGHYVVLIFTLLYVAAFGCTLGAVTWVYLSEIFPNRVRGIAMSVATLALWLADFLVSYTFPMMVERLGTALTLLTYGGACALAFLFFVLRLKETKGRSLEEMNTLFVKS